VAWEKYRRVLSGALPSASTRKKNHNYFIKEAYSLM
jgi:hypothetical protein